MSLSGSIHTKPNLNALEANTQSLYYEKVFYIRHRSTLALDSEQKIMILMDEVNRSEPRIKEKEADQFRKDIQPNIELAEKNGWIIDLPFVL